jgi:L-ascorbate metabolism protein UlaG (beta-lactamase superfamily)
MLLSGALALAGCGGALEQPASGIVEPSPTSGEGVRLVYLGTGGWLFEHEGAQVLAGPLFSNPAFLTTGLGLIEPDTVAIDRYMSRLDVSGAAAILVGHAHYDHLMDVPRVARRHAPDARILGSRTVLNTLGTWSGLMDRVEVMNEVAGDEATSGHWVHLGTSIRVMALRSLHGPHFDGLTFYAGTAEGPRAEMPGAATEWVDGETYAFLVDFLDAGGGVVFRIYYQDAVAPPPWGFAPDAVVSARPVDVAILVPATFEEVPWHPEAIVRNLRPRRVLLGHWEDFFKPFAELPRPVPFTDLSEFEARLGRAFTGPVWRPDRFTEFRFPACADCS